MRAVFDQDQVVGGNHLHDAVHIGEVTPHVRQHQETRAAGLGFRSQVIQINHQIVCDFDKNRLTAGVDDCAGDRCKRERIRQNLLAHFETRSLESGTQGITAGSTGEAVLTALPGGIFCFELRRL